MQILVEVANIQASILKTEVGKGSVRTAVGHGSGDPKGSAKAFEARKGSRLIFRRQHAERRQRMCAWRRRTGSWREMSPFVDGIVRVESHCAEKRAQPGRALQRSVRSALHVP